MTTIQVFSHFNHKLLEINANIELKIHSVGYKYDFPLSLSHASRNHLSFSHCRIKSVFKKATVLLAVMPTIFRNSLNFQGKSGTSIIILKERAHRLPCSSSQGRAKNGEINCQGGLVFSLPSSGLASLPHFQHVRSTLQSPFFGGHFSSVAFQVKKSVSISNENEEKR